MRIRKTISLKKEVYDKLIEQRKDKTLSKFISDLLEDLLIEKEKLTNL